MKETQHALKSLGLAVATVALLLLAPSLVNGFHCPLPTSEHCYFGASGRWRWIQTAKHCMAAASPPRTIYTPAADFLLTFSLERGKVMDLGRCLSALRAARNSPSARAQIH